MSGYTEAEKEVIATKAWDTALLKRLLGYAKPHKWLFFQSFLVILGLFALDLAGPYVLRRAIDGPVAEALVEPESGEVLADAAVPEDTDEQLRRLGLHALLYLTIMLAAGGFRYLQAVQLGRTGQAVIHDLRTHLFRHMQRQDLAWYDARPTGALVTRVTGDIENLNELFTSGLIVLVFDFVKIFAILAILFTLDSQLALFVLALTPLLVVTSLGFRGGARRAHRVVRARLADLNGYLQEVLSGIRVVQMFRREERVAGRFAGLLGSYFRANLRTILLFALFFPSIEFLTIVIKGAIVWRGGSSILTGALTMGVFFQFWFYLQHYLNPIRELGERYNVMQQAFASSERVFHILDTEPEVGPPAAAKRPEPFRGRVAFDRVSFSYLEGTPVIEDISFEIPAGDTVAIVGATGAGKSTLVNLLLRFYDPSAGTVSIDGIDLRELDPTEHRSHLGLVQQEDFLFTGTVRENLALGRASVSDASIARALEVSCAGDVVRRLPGGLDAEVAERGVTLSTGERELLAIARALAADPHVVILDEATSSVDSGTEARIEEATHNLLRGRTALVVAHRLSTVRRADRILVLHKGRLREQGTHEELLEQGGLYAKLYALQFRDADDTARAG
ncbi:MAG: ABC transporter ATP-binding protein [Planctomycetota bacterium]